MRRIAIVASALSLALPVVTPPGLSAQQRPEGAPIEERAVAAIPEPGTCFLPGTTSFDDAIGAHVRAQLRSIAHCWDRCVRCAPREGRLVVAIEVADRGVAERVSIVEQTLEDAALASCVAGAIARLPMPRPPRGVARGAAQIPFVFVADRSR